MRERPKEEVLAEIRERVTLLPGHERGHRPADLAPHRPYALRHARQHRGQGLRRRPHDAAIAGAPGRGRDDAGIEGVVDLSMEQQTDIPTVRVRVRPGDAARYGLQPGEVDDA